MILNAIKDSLFRDLEDQSLAKNLLTSSINNNRISPAYLFFGPKGVGQKEFAIRFLEGILTHGEGKLDTRNRLENLNHPDLLWVEPTYTIDGKLVKRSNTCKEDIKNKLPPQIRLEQIREVTLFLGKKPVESKLGMIIIEEVEYMNEAASNALLKTLEEPINGILILITYNKVNLLNTIKSRCQEIPFRGLSSNLLQKKLLTKVEDKQTKKFEKELLDLSQGSPKILQENLELLKDFPKEILEKALNIPDNYLNALTSAKIISEELNIDQQCWLINFLQYHFWNKNHCLATTKKLEKLKKYLLSSVQPRIAWEITLIELKEINER